MFEQLQERIIAYLGNELPAEERAAFETELRESPELAEEVAKYRQMSIMVQHQHLIEANAMLGSIMAEVPVEPDYGQHEQYFKPNPAGGAWKLWLGLGITALVLVAGWWFYQHNLAEQRIQSLGQNNLVPLENIIGFVSDDPGPAAQGMQAYDQKDYAKAIRLLQTAVADSPDDTSLQLYLAVSHLMLGHHQAADAVLQELSGKNDLSSVPAQWYLALSLLQQRQGQQAKVLLEQVQVDTILGPKAKIILRNLGE